MYNMLQLDSKLLMPCISLVSIISWHVDLNLWTWLPAYTQIVLAIMNISCHETWGETAGGSQVNTDTSRQHCVNHALDDLIPVTTVLHWPVMKIVNILCCILYNKNWVKIILYWTLCPYEKHMFIVHCLWRCKILIEWSWSLAQW